VVRSCSRGRGHLACGGDLRSQKRLFFDLAQELLERERERERERASSFLTFWSGRPRVPPGGRAGRGHASTSWTASIPPFAYGRALRLHRCNPIDPTQTRTLCGVYSHSEFREFAKGVFT